MSQANKRGLGRGFEALLSQDFDKSALLTSDEQIEHISLSDLKANSGQPRKQFDEASIRELAASIKRHGIIQPLIVTPYKNGAYTLIAGERRFRAAEIAGLKSVPAIVRDKQELEQLEIALIENVQRVDLSPLEQAASIQRLHEQFNLGYEAIARRLGKASSTIQNTARLLGLSDEARDALAKKKITEGHGRAILALRGDVERQAYLLKTIIEQSWSVRQAERFVLSVKAGVKEGDKAKARVDTETPETKALSKKLGTPVQVRRMAHGGRLEISFGSDRELDRIIRLFGL